MVVQGLFVASTLLGLATASLGSIKDAAFANPAYRAAVGHVVAAAPSAESDLARTLQELWFNAKPILLEVLIPALLMGLAFPLANAIIQRAEATRQVLGVDDDLAAHGRSSTAKAGTS